MCSFITATETLWSLFKPSHVDFSSWSFFSGSSDIISIWDLTSIMHSFAFFLTWKKCNFFNYSEQNFTTDSTWNKLGCSEYVVLTLMNQRCHGAEHGKYAAWLNRIWQKNGLFSRRLNNGWGSQRIFLLFIPWIKTWSLRNLEQLFVTSWGQSIFHAIKFLIPQNVWINLLDLIRYIQQHCGKLRKKFQEPWLRYTNHQYIRARCWMAGRWLTLVSI